MVSGRQPDVPAVHVEMAGKKYGRSVALEDVSFARPPGSVTLVIGRNGAGKSTLLYRMANLVSGQGSTTFFGCRWQQLRQPRDVVGASLGTDGFHPRSTVRDHLTLVGRTCEKGVTHVEECLARFNLESVVNERVENLSLGMRQRLSLAVAAAPDPDVYLLDEPFNALDPHEAVGVHAWLRDARDQGKAFIIATHFFSGVELHATHLLGLKRGNLVLDGELPRIRREHHEVLGGARFAAQDIHRVMAELRSRGVRVVQLSETEARTIQSTPQCVRRAAQDVQVQLEGCWECGPAMEDLFECLV